MSGPTRCAACPVPDEDPCRGPALPFLCAWAAGGDPTQRAHVVARSKLPPPPPDFPPLATQAARLARAAVRFVGSGLAVAPAEEQARRRAICAACPHFVGNRCAKCGCNLNAKVMMSTEHCPIEKW